ncbi:MMPL family transporter [Liquorilactobacillus satsumensis]|nr:MMPL family transporter [Liquorilactobacillus satsumensis]MCP9312743.1 MMPL family transporter [Liquorilactobacillus satsumensis]MCP9327991.1 MMPL family transporter [Liquorilactobacillus satsumensis]MCP9359244.1 MMPL family transporter [Liquorilactobacillus satsumensis]
MRGSKKQFIIQAVVWLLIMCAAVILLPNVGQLVRDKGQMKLPSSAKSQVAQVIQDNWGRDQGNTRQVVVVFNNGSSPLTTAQKNRIKQTVSHFKTSKQKYGIKDVTAANDNAATKKQLISKDKSTELLQLMVDKQQTVKKMKTLITSGAKTQGVKTYVTGSDILNDDFIQETEQGLKKTELITVIFIFIILTLVFRSPITPLVSLLSVGVSFIISLSVVMNLVEKFNFPLSNFTQVFMVVVLFGIGTDYNILLFDQYKEELSREKDVITATRNALRIAGRTILYSGSSVLIGFTALGLANFSVYRSAVGVAVAVAVLLLVLLTLNPFFMWILGRRLFWPTKNFGSGSSSRLWHGISTRAVRHPFIAIALVLVIGVPFLATYHNELNYDTLAELNDSIPAKKGFKVVQKHFSKGTAEPSTLYIKTNHPLNNEKDLKEIDALTRRLKKIAGVKTVASVTQPGGSEISSLYVTKQLKTVTNGMKSASSGLNQIGTGLNSANQQLGNANLQQGVTGAKQLASGTATLKSGSQQLSSGATTLANGASALQQGTTTYTSGINTLNNALNTLNSKQSQITTGVGTLNSSVAKLQSGSQQVAAGLAQLQSKVNAATGTGNTAQIQELKSKLGELNSAMAQLEKSTGSTNLPDISGIKTTATALTSSSTKAQNDAQTLQTALTSLASSNSDAATQQKMLNEIFAAIAQTGTALNTQQKAALTTVMSSIAKSNVQQLSGATTAASSLKNDLSALTTAGNSLNTELNQLNALSSQLSQLSNLNQLAASSIQANTASMQALDKLSSAVQGMQQIKSALNGSTGQTGLTSGSQQVASGLSQLSSGTDEMASQLSQYTSGVASVTAGANKLASNSGTLTNGTAQLAAGNQQLAEKQSELTAGLTTVNSGQQTMYNSLQGLVGQMQTLRNGLSTASNGTQKINQGVGSANSYLTGLKNSAASKTYYVPKSVLQGKTYKQSLQAYMSGNYNATKITIVLDENPSSESAMNKISTIQDQAQKSLKGTALAGATVAIGGQTSTTHDLQQTASNDFLRTATIMLIGILIALMVITRSVLQPLYILGTLLLAYVMSLSITKLISSAFLGQSMLTWNTPFFGFIMLIALGVDYSIFLMMKYREFGNFTGTPIIRIVRASAVIGTVVISAAVILSGTFAALIPSGVLTLIQVALVVIIGLIILVFAIPTIIPSLIRLTYPLKDKMDDEEKFKETEKKQK